MKYGGDRLELKRDGLFCLSLQDYPLLLFLNCHCKCLLVLPEIDANSIRHMMMAAQFELIVPPRIAASFCRDE